jgi:hypothetical protein
MITAKDELFHAIETLDEREAEQALAVLQLFWDRDTCGIGQAAEFASATKAIQAARSMVAIRLAGKNMVVPRQEADQLEAAGAEFAFLGEHNGRVVTVPVNG